METMVDTLSGFTEALAQLGIPWLGWLALILVPFMGMAVGVAEADQRRPEPSLPQSP